jgi:hypothetical protein
MLGHPKVLQVLKVLKASLGLVLKVQLVPKVALVLRAEPELRVMLALLKALLAPKGRLVLKEPLEQPPRVLRVMPGLLRARPVHKEPLAHKELPVHRVQPEQPLRGRKAHKVVKEAEALKAPREYKALAIMPNPLVLRP